jgi:hypothetical protein
LIVSGILSLVQIKRFHIYKTPYDFPRFRRLPRPPMKSVMTDAIRSIAITSALA